ncbi:hypothetical protein AB0E72_03025, partial [Streptomyces filamentosus]
DLFAKAGLPTDRDEVGKLWNGDWAKFLAASGPPPSRRHPGNTSAPALRIPADGGRSAFRDAGRLPDASRAVQPRARAAATTASTRRTFSGAPGPDMKPKRRRV